MLIMSLPGEIRAGCFFHVNAGNAARRSRQAFIQPLRLTVCALRTDEKRQVLRAAGDSDTVRMDPGHAGRTAGERQYKRFFGRPGMPGEKGSGSTGWGQRLPGCRMQWKCGKIVLESLTGVV